MSVPLQLTRVSKGHARNRIYQRITIVSGHLLAKNNARLVQCSQQPYSILETHISTPFRLKLPIPPQQRFSKADNDDSGAISLSEYLLYHDTGSLYPWHCVLCPLSTYKPGPLNSQCLSCPNNTYAVSRPALPTASPRARNWRSRATQLALVCHICLSFAPCVTPRELVVVIISHAP